MISSIDNALKAKLASHMNARHPQFKKAPTKIPGALAGCDVYMWKVDSTKTGWIIFGGDKKSDRDIIADIAWTRTGKKLVGLDYLDWWSIPSPYPDDGVCKFLYSGVVGADFSEKRYFEIDGPPPDLQEFALQNYTKSEIFLKTVQSRQQKLLRKDPTLTLPDAEAQAIEANMKGSRPFFTLWSTCSESIELQGQDVEAAIAVVMSKVISVLDKNVVAFIEERLK